MLTWNDLPEKLRDEVAAFSTRLGHGESFELIDIVVRAAQVGERSVHERLNGYQLNRIPDFGVTPINEKGPRPYHTRVYDKATRAFDWQAAKDEPDSSGAVRGTRDLPHWGFDGNPVPPEDPSKTLPPGLPDARSCPHEYEIDRFHDEGGPPPREVEAKPPSREAFLKAMGWSK